MIHNPVFGGLRITNGYRIRSLFEGLRKKKGEPEFRYGCVGIYNTHALPLYKYDPEDGSGIDKIRFKPSDIVNMRQKMTVEPTAIT